MTQETKHNPMNQIHSMKCVHSMKTIHNMTGGHKMNDVQHLREVQETSDVQINEFQELYLSSLKIIEDLKFQLSQKTSSKKGSLRKSQVLELLKESPITIYDMSMTLDISNKNVSSILCYLKNDGHRIATNSNKEKFLEDYKY